MTPTFLRLSPTGALSAGLLLSLATGCIETPNGSTFIGSNVNRSVSISGYALSPGDTIRVEVLANANQDPDSANASWVQIGTTVSNTSPVLWQGGQLYTFSLSVTPVTGRTTTARWPAGGLVRLRAKNGSGSFVQTFDDTDCYSDAVSAGKPFQEIFSECKSHDTPILTFVDEDPINLGPQTGSDGGVYLVVRENSLDGGGAYNDKMNAPGTLNAWIASRFPTFSSEVVARYYNKGDLGIGREMHCTKNSGGGIFEPLIACYVKNYGSTDDRLADEATALDDAIAGHAPFATVAMDYWPLDPANKVRFYTYGAQGQLVKNAVLDSESAVLKPTPGICLSCHGGLFFEGSTDVAGASFLPFDLDAFGFKSSGTYSKQNQQDSFRRLNLMVRDTNPGASTTSLIDGWYGGYSGLTTPGTQQNSGYLPPGWADEAVVYDKAVKPFCRTCHVAVNVPMDTSADLRLLDANKTQLPGEATPMGAVQRAVCEKKFMPHAEVTREAFWKSSGRAHLAGALDWGDACE